MDDLLAEFVAEADATLAAMDRAALDMARSPGDAAALLRLFRLVHTLKGSCGYLGLVRLERLAHASEDVLGAVREGTILPEAATEWLFAALDATAAILAALAACGAEPPGEDGVLIAYLHALAAGQAVAPPPERPGRSSAAFAPPRHTTSWPHRRSIGHAWRRLPGLVRALARDLGKSIELVTAGAETELDRHTLEQLAGPLAHLVRNSADHGLEQPDERLASGKPATGRITLTAAREANGRIVITIEDDGRGLQAAGIREQAVARKLARPGEVALMTDAVAAQFVFSPGVLDRCPPDARVRPGHRLGRGEDQRRTDRRNDRGRERGRPWHQLPDRAP